MSPDGWVSLDICAGAGTVLTDDDVVVFVITILQLPEFLGILTGVLSWVCLAGLVQAGVYRKLPSSFVCLKALEVSE